MYRFVIGKEKNNNKQIDIGRLAGPVAIRFFFKLG